MTAIKPVQISMPSDTEILIARDLDAPPELVWAAWTDTKLVPRWMLGPPGWTMPVCEIDLRVGGTWRFVWRKSGGQEMAMTGIYKEIQPFERLVSTERWGPEWPETINTVELVKKTGGTTTVNQYIRYPSKAARDAAAATPMADGVETSFQRLEDEIRKMK